MKRIVFVSFLIFALTSLIPTSAFVGDEDLARAFDAALLELISDGTIDGIYIKNEIAPTKRIDDCSPSSTYFAFPQLASTNPNGTLMRVLKSGRLIVSTRPLAKGKQGDYSNNPPNGLAPDIERAVIKHIGEHYGYSLAAVFDTRYATSEEAFDGLTAGKSDMGTALNGIGGFYQSLRRSVVWRTGCSAMSDNVSLIVKNTLPASTYEQFLEVLSMTPQPVIGTVGRTEMQLMQHVFVDVLIENYNTNAEALKALMAGKVLALGGVVMEVETGDVKYITLGLVMPRAAFFRRERPLSLKVRDVNLLPPWQTGNELLALTYEAAVNGMLQQDTFSKIFQRYNVTSFKFADCFASSSAYRVPDVATGTLFEVARNKRIRIGTIRGDFYPLWKMNDTTVQGAIFEMETKLVDWISKLLGKDVGLQYVQFDTHEQVLKALDEGKVEMTTTFFFLGGFISGIPTRTRFRYTCTTMALDTFFVVRAEDNITSLADLYENLSSAPDQSLGAVTQNSEAMIRQLLRLNDDDRTIEHFNSNAEAYAALQSKDIFAVMPVHPEPLPPQSPFVMFSANRIMPLCAFFRLDRTNACGDSIIDKSFNEQCEITGFGCKDNCSCDKGYIPYEPARISCLPGPGGDSHLVAIIIGASIGGIALIFVGIAAGFGVMMFRNRRSESSELTTPLSETLQEYDPGDIALGLRVSPAALSFGAASMQLPLDQEFQDRIIISGVSRDPTAFMIEFPNIPTYKCSLAADITSGEVVRGQDITVTLTLKMLCTTVIDLPLLVVVPEKGYATVHVSVESQLSTRLDPDEVVMGKKIGAGSFGTVYRGEWRGVDVAVKSYNETALTDVGLRGDIEREVEMCFKLRMPFIVTFYGRTVSANKLCIVMEYVHYGSLGAMLVKPDPILLKFKVRVALDVAKGMNFLHKNRVIHRDLKSDNVLIACLDTNAPVVAKLSDFNTSRFWGSEAMRTKTKGVGTPVFMAPEIIDGKHYSWMADVYSYAMLLWNLWTQKEPYSNFESSFVFFMFVLEGNRLPIPPELPEPLATITRDCWKHIPEERPNFQAVVQRFEAIFAATQ